MQGVPQAGTDFCYGPRFGAYANHNANAVPEIEQLSKKT
jgi:hypothetical protein